MDEVVCSECGHRYDSEEHTFCSRCGNTATRKGVQATDLKPAAFDSRRRRVQMAGIMLVTIAAMTITLYTMAMVQAPELVEDLGPGVLATQPGGEIAVHFAGIEGAVVNMTWPDGSANGTTDANGTFVAQSGSALAQVNVTYDGQTWQRKVLALTGGTTDVDLGPDEPLEAEMVGGTELVQTIRILLGFFTLMALFVLGGGIAAIRLRQRNIAIGGAVAGLLPVFVLATAVPNFASMILVIVLALALAFIVHGRGSFR